MVFNRGTIELVTKLQALLAQREEEEIDYKALAADMGYSESQLNRLFKQHLHMTPKAYVRKLRLTRGAIQLQSEENKGLPTALDARFRSQDGFIKAFKREFSMTPGEFLKKGKAIPFFEPSPLSHYYILKNGGNMGMDTVRPVIVQIVKKESHKLILKRGIQSTDYFSYCAEIGCDIWGILDSVKDKLDAVAFTEHLPSRYILPGTSRAACCVEVPLTYSGEPPEGCDIIEVPECEMAYFQGMTYDDPDWFPNAHREIQVAIRNYKPELYGYRVDYEAAPELCFGASPETGCRNAVPVVRIVK